MAAAVVPIIRIVITAEIVAEVTSPTAKVPMKAESRLNRNRQEEYLTDSWGTQGEEVHYDQ